ncbi:hypothetical protein ACFX15_037842 [Malus domestica]
MTKGTEVRYFPPPILWVLLAFITQEIWGGENKTGRHLRRAQTTFRYLIFVKIINGTCYWEEFMANQDVDDLVVHLEKGMDLSTMEQGIALVGAALVNKNLNKWGVRNILRSSWKDLGEVDIKWVKDNLYIITVQDESTTGKILSQVPWAVMKQNFSIKRWPKEMALEEIEVAKVPFWVQIRGVPPCLISVANVQRLAKEIGEFVEVENLAKARGFLRVRIIVNTQESLITGCWLPRDEDKDTWVEFRYERLQDFYYRCRRIGHNMNECSYEQSKGGAAGFGEWTKAAHIREMIVNHKSLPLGMGARRQAGVAHAGRRSPVPSSSATTGRGLQDSRLGQKELPDLTQMLKRGWKRRFRFNHLGEGSTLNISNWTFHGVHHMLTRHSSMGSPKAGLSLSADCALQRHIGGNSNVVIEEIGGEGNDGRNMKSGAELSDIQPYHKRSKFSEQGNTSQGGGGWPDTAVSSP